ncbi:MAG: type II secretion system F family protein [Gammaproteobacteria bacterium]|nr:type II secretion system F family protein [Gammaproteobacteria bacterium]
MDDQRTFAWEGTAHSGGQRSGELSAPSAAIARAKLRREGVEVHRLRQKRRQQQRRGRIKAVSITLFSRQLATMMRAGVPMVQTLDILSGETKNPSAAAMIAAVRADIGTGATLSLALARFPQHFDALYRNLVDIGEQSGTLDEMLDRIATYQEKSADIRRKAKKALTYPALVVVAAIIVTAIMLIHVVPQFEAVFASAGAELPAATRLVVALSEIAQRWWWVVASGLVLLGLGWAVLRKRSAAFRNAIDRASLLTPVAGPILARAAVARFARTLGTALAAGVPLVEALGAVAGATGNAAYVAAVLAIRDEVTAGRSLQAAMRERGMFPSTVVRMVAIGEESGRLDDLLGRSAEQLEIRVDEAVDQLTTLIEPMTMGVLGVLVGGLIVAMYLPVFQLGAAFGG